MTSSTFATQHLGATQVPSPYEPDRPNCTQARWVLLPKADGAGTADAGFMMHFVFSHEWPGASGAGTSVTAIASATERLRATTMRRNVFDRWMYNRLIYWAGDVLPYIAHLEAAGAPYVLRGWPGASTASVLLNVPENGIAIELRGGYRPATPSARWRAWDACEVETA